MLRSITIDNAMLRCLADKINNYIQEGNKVDRKFLSEAIWDYENTDAKNPKTF